jgi:hypothetical protein
MTGGKVYCTSYARACHEAYYGLTDPRDSHLVKAGRCFGDFTITVDDLQGAGCRGRAIPTSRGAPTASAGSAHLFREETIEETVRHADGALYEAKRQGRNRAVLAEA